MITSTDVKKIRTDYAAGRRSFLNIRKETGLSDQAVKLLLSGKTFLGAGGPFTTEFPGVVTLFPDELSGKREWKREYMKKYRREKADRQKAMALDILGNHCVKCGTTENLQFDHIDPSTKRFHILQQITGSWEEIEKEVCKCQLLCYACHKDKSAAETAERNAIIFSGERHIRAKLTDAQARSLRKRFAAGGLTITAVSRETGMSTKNVRLMLRGITYRRAGGPLASAEDAINYIDPEAKPLLREEVVRLFKAGTTSMQDIAAATGVSPPTVKTYLTDAGLLEPGQNLKLNQKHSKLTHDQVREYRERYTAGGLTMTAIAAEVGMSLAGVSRFLKGRSYASAGGPLAP